MVSSVPHGFHSVTPSIVCTPCADAIDWYVAAFGAEEVEDRMVGPDGKIGHAEIRIGDSVVMLADEWPGGPVSSPTVLGGSTAALFVYTDDVDGLWERVVDAGAEEVYPLADQFYGHRSGRIRDPFGHTWGLSQVIEELTPEQMNERVQAFYEEQAE